MEFDFGDAPWPMPTRLSVITPSVLFSDASCVAVMGIEAAMNEDIAALFLPRDVSGKSVAVRASEVDEAPVRTPGQRAAAARRSLRSWFRAMKRRRTYSVVRADRHWHTWGRLHTPMWGSRPSGRIALRPAPRTFTTAVAVMVSVAAVVVVAEAFSVTSRWTVAFLAGGLLLSYLVGCPVQREGWTRAGTLVPGDMIRQPRRPFSARIVSSAHTINGTTYIEFHNGPARTYDAGREVTVVRARSERHVRWHYGRSYSSSR